jgi:hypothetical protein
MKPEKFPYDRFLKFKEQKENSLVQLLSAVPPFTDVPVLVTAPCDVFGAVSADRVRSLELQLDALALSMQLESDLAFTYLEPWHGVGVYASMFGCPVEWSTFDAPQTHPVIKTVDELQDLPKPNVLGSEMARRVIDTIHYFRQQTGDQLHIVLTDTQSPNDTASLIMETNEFFAYHRQDPTRLTPLLDRVTDAIIEFSELQFEAIGPCRVQPGHIMLSGKKLAGISLSDDNMSFLSKEAYQNCSLGYNNRLAEHFGGIAIHTCGNFVQHYEMVKQMPGLIMFDCAIAGVDPSPNNPLKLSKSFAGSGVLLKVRMGFGDEYLPLLDDLVDPNLKLIVQIASDGDVEKSRTMYWKIKEKCREVLKRKQ